MKIIKILIFLSLLGCYMFTYADIDNNIDHLCKTHKLSNIETSKKCAGVLKAQYRFETGHGKKIRNNNLFNFGANGVKKIWRENFGVTGISNGYLIFNSEIKSIEFAVNRFYLYDINDSIEKIVDDFCTAPRYIKNNYIHLIKEYIKKEYKQKYFMTSNSFLCRLLNNNFKNANKQQSSKMIYRGFNIYE